jgi:hypothetical protein
MDRYATGRENEASLSFAPVLLCSARKLRVKPLYSLKKHLHLRQCSRIVVSGLGTMRIRLPAHLAALACADIPGAVVCLTKAPPDGLQLVQRTLSNFGLFCGVHDLKF